MQVLENICIIPARGGSKRLPGKNVKDFFGKPVIAYAIECAQKTGLFDIIHVSTDCERIADISRSHGAQVPFLRSAEASDDHATTHAVLKEVLTEYEKRRMRFSRVLCLYPVTPLVGPDDLFQGLEALDKVSNGMIFPVIEYSHPIWRAISIENGLGKRIWSENTQSRTQDLQSTYHDSGQWYWMWAESLLKEDTWNAFPIIPIIIDEGKAQDVDTVSDWRILELKFKAMKNI